jgi:signal transduction histidine kinase
MNSSLLPDAALGSEGGQAALGDTTRIGWSLASDPALFITAVNALVACGDLGELAAGAAHLTQKLLGTTDVLVLMRGPDGEFSGGRGGASKDLESWATELLQAGAAHSVSSGGQHLGAPIQAASVGVSGVITASLPESSENEVSRVLGSIANLASSCSAQILGRTQARRALLDTQETVARGLHDLCTPLNSLRLGMHLLEPALSDKDPAVAQRAHRAVDRMATLVTNMADSLRKSEG